MATMSFGEHIEELRVRLILALLGLFVGVIVVFLPPLDIGWRVMKSMEAPAKIALKEYYRGEYEKTWAQADAAKAVTPTLLAAIPAGEFATELARNYPDLRLPEATTLKGLSLNVPLTFRQADIVTIVRDGSVQIDTTLISLSPLETPMIFFMVCIVCGLVLASPWVFYQAWAFVAAGLYRHERRYVQKYLPFSIGLFLTGVGICFFLVLPMTLKFLLQFNVWLGIAPTYRLSDWMGFATILPLVFGVTFETPLVMLFLERIHIFTVDDFRSKRKIAILIMTIVAAVITPGQDPISMLLLAVPMVLLYELGILLVSRGRPKASHAAA